MHVCSVAQSWPTFCNAIDLAPEAHLSRDSPGKNTGVGFHALLQGIFLTQGLNTCLLHLLHWQEGFLFVCLFTTKPPGKPKICFSSVQFSHSVMSDSLRPHGSQHTRPPCPSSIPRTHVPRIGDAIPPSHPLSSPYPPAPNPSQHQGLFQWVKICLRNSK